MSVKSDDVKSISVELLFENRKNIIFNVLYRQFKGQIKSFEKFLKETFSRIMSSNKQFHVAGDFNLNVLEYEICKKVQEKYNLQIYKIQIYKIQYNLQNTIYKIQICKKVQSMKMA